MKLVSTIYKVPSVSNNAIIIIYKYLLPIVFKQFLPGKKNMLTFLSRFMISVVILHFIENSQGNCY